MNALRVTVPTQTGRRPLRSSAGFARASDRPMTAGGDRWGVSGGAALAPPDVEKTLFVGGTLVAIAAVEWAVGLPRVLRLEESR